jgi:CHAD domain-containing protein
MRGAARRTRAALQEFRKLFRGAQIEQLISELRWLGQELGAARDEEVLRDLLLEELDEVPVESVLGPVRARLAGHFAPRLAEAERRVLETLDSPRYLALLDELEEFVANPPSVADAEQRAAAVLPRLVLHSQGRVKRRMRAARRAPAGERRDHALHDARKAAKRARYAAEAAALALGRQPRRSAKALKRLQSTLGDHHDAVIAAHALRTLALNVHAEGENPYTYGILSARQDERAERLADRAHRQWRRANRSKRTAWMR